MYQEIPFTGPESYHTEVDVACALGDIAFLKSWIHHNFIPDKWTKNAIDWASSNGHVEVLQLLYDENMFTKWTYKAMDSASANGRVNVLDWFYTHVKRLKYTHAAMDLAAGNGHVVVLDWWLSKQKTLSLKYTEDAVDLASTNGHLSILEWFHKSPLQMLWSDDAIQGPIRAENVPILLWWADFANHEARKFTCIHTASMLYAQIDRILYG